jgi:hypothetical protein
MRFLPGNGAQDQRIDFLVARSFVEAVGARGPGAQQRGDSDGDSD